MQANYRHRYQPHRPSRGSGHGFGGNRIFKSFNPIQIVQNTPQNHPKEPFSSVHQFSDFQISEVLKSNIASKGYSVPTPIQDQAISPILAGRDIIGIACTGTGKTAAFLIPLIEKVQKNRQEKVLILAPTRELADQTQSEFVSLSRFFGIFSVLCIGGVNIKPQRSSLRRLPNFIIGTPGRIRDLVQEKSLDLSNFRTVVLDEADHMVDIGFLNDIKFLISLMPANRQSLFFSATIDGKVQEILQGFVRDAVTVSVKTQDTVDNIQQTVVRVVDKNRKIDQLHDLLIQKEYEKVLIFGRTKWGVQKLSDELVRRGFKADAIHGNKRQNQRQHTLNRFKKSEIQILLATDVASRGLDIPNVSHVINYDLPDTQDAYIHRIGRTGRADKKGIALTFIE